MHPDIPVLLFGAEDHSEVNVRVLLKSNLEAPTV